MEQKIYQNGFYLFIGLFIGLMIHYGIVTNERPKTDTIKIEVVNDSVKAAKVSPTASVTKKALTEKNLRAELRKNEIPHANIVLAQAKLESGLGTSAVYKKTNNLFGLRKGKRYRSYSHWTECVKDYKKCISNRYKGGNYYTFLDQIGYAENPNYTDILKTMV